MLGGQQLRQPDHVPVRRNPGASRLGAEQSAKLCVQYLAPIIKNRQYNFPPLGLNLFVGAQCPTQRDHLQRGLDAAGLHSAATAASALPPAAAPPAPAPPGPPLAAEVPIATNPADGLSGMMVPAGGRTMMRAKWLRVAASLLVAGLALAGCGRGGLNSIPLPGDQGVGPGSFSVQAQMPDVDNIEPNSRVRVGDVNVGTVRKIERQDWHALVTMELNGDVDLPANATAKLGQTSLLGSLHIELAPPTDVAPEGKLHDGSLIPLASSGLSEHRADARGNFTAAQRRWHR